MACRNGVCTTSKGGSNMPRGNKGVQLSQPQNITTGSQLTSINPNQNRTWGEWISEMFAGKPEIIQYLNKYNPGQQGGLDYLLQSGQEQLQDPYKGFEPIRQNALNTFHQDIVPRLQEQFSASGSNSASSGTLKSELSSAGASLAEKLAAFQSHFGQQNEQTGLQRIQLGLNPQYEIANRPRTPGLVENVWDTASQAAPTLAKLAYKMYTGGLG